MLKVIVGFIFFILSLAAHAELGDGDIDAQVEIRSISERSFFELNKVGDFQTVIQLEAWGSYEVTNLSLTVNATHVASGHKVRLIRGVDITAYLEEDEEGLFIARVNYGWRASQEGEWKMEASIDVEFDDGYYAESYTVDTDVKLTVCSGRDCLICRDEKTAIYGGPGPFRGNYARARDFGYQYCVVNRPVYNSHPFYSTWDPTIYYQDNHGFQHWGDYCEVNLPFDRYSVKEICVSRVE